MMKHWINVNTVAVAFIVAIFSLTYVQKASAESLYYSSFFGTAVEGYDVVAYFTDGKPMEGSKDHKVKWKGVDWYFASDEHKKLFESDPEKYAPQYGGYCAWAVSQGYTASTVPEAWRIVDGKLYLNYSKGVQKTWEENIPGNITQANKNWPGIAKDLE